MDRRNLLRTALAGGGVALARWNSNGGPIAL